MARHDRAVTPGGHTARRVIVLFAIVAVAAVIATSDFAHVFVVHVLDVARDVIAAYPVAGKVLFLVLSALSAMLAFFSSAIVVPVAVYAWGDRTTLLLLWIAWLIGGSCSYLIGRTIGRDVARWLVDPKRVDYYSSLISHDARFVTVLLFQLALPSEVPGYVLGAVRYAFWKYLVVLALAELPFAAGAVYLGDSFVRRDYLVFVAIGLAGVLVTAIAFRRLHHETQTAARGPRLRARFGSGRSEGGSESVREDALRHVPLGRDDGRDGIGASAS